MKFLKFVLLNTLCLLAFTAYASPVKRVIALSPHAVEQLYAIGAGELIVATTEHADFPVSAKNIPTIGGFHGIQIERILELAPDLIVYWGSGNKTDDIQRLKQLGFNLYNSDPKTLHDVVLDLKVLGELTGRQKITEKVINDFKTKLTRLRLANHKKTKVKVFYQLWSNPLMTVSKNSWIQQLIQVCNGENVFYDAEGDYPQVSIENVLLVKPEVILASKDKGNLQGINWEKWSMIPAVKNGNIYPLNADLLHRPTPRALDGIVAICQAIDTAR
ncbi:cobalamin-binding protein [Parashewanella spongiae]|uniref:Cobalamin-binding protein n=1 Tax=Parashewanella spongiae TaxID=342950 RepID=A0A3A6STL0_9GAMM|nr:cobalamin-binding protein [Parashewanella spongiae]MCL1080242.1 cobalamin-binding protein [Parashewanella spongiae]RJY01906.1 cobalamin-binding protein [Parashewanella spongiae]